MTGLTTCFRVMRDKHGILFGLVSTNFLGNVRSENYKELVEDMLMQYHKLFGLQYASKGPLPSFASGTVVYLVMFSSRYMFIDQR